LAAFRAAFRALLGAALPGGGVFLALGAPFLGLAFLVEVAFFGAMGAPGAATAAACVAVVVSVVFIVVPFLRDWRTTFITLGAAEGKCGC
jgi:predicted lysophospholipase L1 biosynthesis ABC-type transport system permease subunit